MMDEKLEFTELNPPEKLRVYHFPEDDIELFGVVRICVRKSGTHRLETKDGLKHIVPPGWLAITLDVEGWTL